MRIRCSWDQGRTGDRRSGFTIPEVLIASSIALMVLAGVMSMLILVATEQRRSYADTTVEQLAGNLQDRLTLVLRSMSASESVILADPVVDGGVTVGFRRIIVARGKTPTFPREEVRFDPGAGRVVHDPNRSVAGDEVVLHRNSANGVLRQGWFAPTLKRDGSQDLSLLNTWVVLDDDRTGGHRDASGAIVPTLCQRSFAIKLRNP